MGTSRLSKWKVEEDLCLGEAIMFHKVECTGPGIPNQRGRFAELHQRYARNTALVGIDGTKRTIDSFWGRIRTLRKMFDEGRLATAGTTGRLEAKRNSLFGKIFGRSEASSARRSGSPAVVAKRMLQYRGNEMGACGRMEKKKKAVELLGSLAGLRKRRTEVRIRREENGRRQREVDESERKWNMEMFQRVLKGFKAEDGCCADLMKTLEGMKDDEVRLAVIREDNVAALIEDERKNGERERETFEELMKRLI